MDRLKREANPPVSQLASPIPQYKTPGAIGYEAVEGQHGAPFATLKDASGNVVSPATEAKLEQVRALLSGVATENKLEQARVLLDTISTKDFATSSNQDALKTVVDDLKSELLLVKSELATIKANQLSGNQKVQLSGAIELIETLLPRTLVTANSSWINKKTPSGAKGFMLLCEIFGMTGTFGTGQGVSLTYLPRGISSNGVNGGKSISTKVSTDVNSCPVIIVYPNVLQSTDIVSSMPIVIPGHVRFHLAVAGSFDEGQGIDCQLVIKWLF